MTAMRLSAGTELLLDGVWHRIEEFDNRQGCVTVRDRDGLLTTVAIETFVNHPGLAALTEDAVTVDVLSQLPEAKRNVAIKRLEHINEAMTGYRSGDPRFALPGEPRPQYDPSTVLQKDRLEAKAAELDNEFARELGVRMSARTIRRTFFEIEKHSSLTPAAGHAAPRASKGRRSICPEVIEATERLIADQRGESSKSITTLFLQLRGRLRADFGARWVEANLPMKRERTWRRYVQERWTPSEINGKARTRGSQTTAQAGGFVRTNPTRPGQRVLLDTNSLDVLLKGTALHGVLRGSLVLALDEYSWSVCALRVVEQAEKNIDVSFALLDVARPKQMLPGWPSEARWPFVGIPESLLVASDPSIRETPGVSGMPFVNPEAVVTDNGSTYRAHKTRQLARQQGFDLLPARTYTPADKAAVERIFGAMNTMLLQHLKGYRGSDTSERGKNTDSEIEWTAQRLEDLLSLWVVLVWQTHFMDDHKPAWCPEGRWSPNALYQHGVETTGLAPRVMTAADYFAVLKSSTVKVHSRGVNIRGLWFDGAVLDPFRNRPSRRADKKYTVHYDIRDLRQVWFVDPNNDRHRLSWVGIHGEFPAFGERHVQALRKRVNGGIDKYTPDYLADVLLTQVLPVRDAEGWVMDGQRADARASKHARDTALATRDAEKFGIPAGPPSAEAGLALEQARRARRHRAQQPHDPTPSIASPAEVHAVPSVEAGHAAPADPRRSQPAIRPDPRPSISMLGDIAAFMEDGDAE